MYLPLASKDIPLHELVFIKTRSTVEAFATSDKPPLNTQNQYYFLNIKLNL